MPSLVNVAATMDFQKTIANEAAVLAEGSLVERLRRNPAVELDSHVEHAGLIYEPRGRAALEELYRQYLDIGKAHDLPMVVNTPTWRANPARLRAAGFTERDEVNGDGFRFVSAIRDSYGDYAGRVFIGGLIGCRGDAYKPDEALSESDAASFHRPQVHALQQAGVDYLKAATLPAAGEAAGIALAMADCGIPYILGFITRPTGTLLDRKPLHEVISAIDATIDPPPLGYMINCVHPAVFMSAMDRATGLDAAVGERVIGLQANTSRRSPEDLDDSERLDADESPEAFAGAMWNAHRRFGVRILGGCCGTDDRHIRCIAERIRRAE